jgi:hypothetical protein
MEADISIWRKPGHFYFALTCVFRACQKKVLLAFKDRKKNERREEAACARKKL